MGFVNYGMTCFSNAVLQCLVHAPGLADLLEAPADGLGPAYTPDALDTLLLTAYAEQRAQQTASLLGGRLAEMAFGGRADEMQQGDTDELLLRCLEQSEARRGRTAHHFAATFFCRNTCSECRWELPGSSLQFESFRVQCDWDADTYASSVSELLYANVGRHYSEEPPGAHTCIHTCLPAPVPGRLISRYFAGTLPSCLALFMQRFKYREAGGQYEGYIDDRCFAISETIELWERNVDSSALPHKRVYALYGLIVFKGRDLNGHYISYVKRDGAWFCAVCACIVPYRQCILVSKLFFAC